MLPHCFFIDLLHISFFCHLVCFLPFSQFMACKKPNFTFFIFFIKYITILLHFNKKCWFSNTFVHIFFNVYITFPWYFNIISLFIFKKMSKNVLLLFFLIFKKSFFCFFLFFIIFNNTIFGFFFYYHWFCIFVFSFLVNKKLIFWKNEFFYFYYFLAF